MQNKSKKKTLTLLIVAIVLLLLSSMFYSLINLNKEPNPKNDIAESNTTTKTSDFPKMAESDIKPSSDKLNIYIFWGDGCPHCKHLSEFLNSHESEIKDYVKIYAFEVWNNSENLNFMKNFGKFLGEAPKGVPYFIIGSKTFSGFSESDTKTKKQILNTIKEESQKNQKIDKYQDFKKRVK